MAKKAQDQLQRYIAAAELTDEAQIAAVTNLHNELRKTGIWDKMVAIYPVVGGTAAKHRWNLRDPDKHNIDFGTTNGHTALGFTTSNYQAAFNVGMADISPNDFHASFYVYNNGNVEYADFGTIMHNYSYLYIRYSGRIIMAWGALEVPSCNSSDATGLRSFNYLNGFGSIYTRGGVASSGYITPNLFSATPFALNPQAQATSRRYSFICIGRSLDGVEMILLERIVQAFQTELERAV